MSRFRALRLPALVALGLALLTPTATRAHSQLFDGTWSSLSGGGPPSPRREYAAVYDVQHQRYLIFAGFFGDGYSVYQLFNEVWVLSLGSTPEWTHLSISGDTPGERHSPQWGYDPARNRVLVFGGYGRHHPGDAYAYLNDVWELSLDGTPQWTELNPSGTPPSGRLAGSAVYDPLRQRFVGFGGTIGVPVDTWQLDLTGDPVWSMVETDSTSGETNGPPGSYGMTSVYDIVRDRMLIFGGSTSDDYYGVHNDVWQLSLVEDTPVWKKLSPTGTAPIARRTLTSVFDPIRDRMVIFGGWDSSENGTASFLNDTWALSLGLEHQWTQLSPAGSPPPGRDAMAGVYDPIGDRLVVFGGWSGEQILGDTWFLTWGGLGQAASMPASSGTSGGVAHVDWNVSNATGSHAAVYRREEGSPWTAVATVERNASGHVTYDDPDVESGGHYGYQVVVASQRGEQFGGETWVLMPGAVSVDPNARLHFALQAVRPNPVRARLAVTFTLPTAAPAKLDLLDLAGRRVASREVGSLGPGVHVVDLGAARDHAPGLYFLRLTQAGESRQTRVVLQGE